jgi:hypothetical protein
MTKPSRSALLSWSALALLAAVGIAPQQPANDVERAGRHEGADNSLTLNQKNAMPVD